MRTGSIGALSRFIKLSVAGALVLAPTAVHAAEITDVADAADVALVGEGELDDPFDLYIGADFEFGWANGKITREPLDPHPAEDRCQESEPRECVPVDEARWKRQTHLMRIKGQIGLFHDLALTFELPFYFGDGAQFRYAQGVGPGNSSIDKQSTNPDDTLFALRSSVNDDQTTKWKRGGLGHLDLGLRFAPLNDERDDSKPTWVVFFKWGMPYTADTYNPSKDRATENNPGAMGDGVHRLTFGTSLSKRIGRLGLIGIDPNANRRGYADPYMEISYTLPIPQKGQAPRELVYSDNHPFGHKPGHIARLNAGLEIVPYEDVRNERKVAVDIGFKGQFCTEGRSYGPLDECSNILAEPLGEIPFSEQNLNISGNLMLVIHAAQYVRFKIGMGIGYVTEHYLTFENVGDDITGPGGEPDGQVLATDGDLLNDYFCGNDPNDICSTKGQDSYDQIGFRFKSEEYSYMNFYAGLMITF